jgi:hypothetical protein
MVCGEADALDSRFPSEEQLPRHFRILVREVVIEGVTHGLLTLDDGRQLGDCVSDDADPPDGYRFHDAFHLACAAVLGWSPVTRRNLKKKRRSDRRADRIEDGGRAAAVEEGISQLVFLYAKNRGFLEKRRNVDHELLQTIIALTAHLEVRVRTAADWERAILMGYDALRSLLAHSGGVLVGDMASAQLRYEPAPREGSGS